MADRTIQDRIDDMRMLCFHLSTVRISKGDAGLKMTILDNETRVCSFNASEFTDDLIEILNVLEEKLDPESKT